mmetsp:Transcript_835/g.1085  ORF Transcript_835/g.1085 Transcript_835/m.1085 type:complete len:89 (+) Transcript_835:116-382(+)
MFALQRTGVQVLQRRFASTSVHGHKIIDMRKGNLKQEWLKDRATYPLIGIISIGGFFAFGVGISCLASNPDVRISPSKRYSKVRTWEN